MSVEVTFYLEDEPSFEAFRESFDEDDDDRPSWVNELEQRPDEGAWTFEAMVLEVESYRPQPGDPIHGTTYRDRVRWRIEAHGRPGDQWVDFSEDVCRRWRGVMYLHATGEIWAPFESKAAPPSEPELEREHSRKELASGGPPAAAIVQQLERQATELATAESTRRADKIEELQERRRRAGEIHVQLPADIETIALADPEQAVKAYAKRYRVPEPTARAVVVRNTSNRDS